MKKVSIILAVDENNWIWKNSDLAWSLKSDMKHFKEITLWNWKNAVIMGRKTWESIPSKFRPLPWRKNVIITRNVDFYSTELQFNWLEESLQHLQNDNEIEEIFIIWWAQIYNYAIQNCLVQTIYLTRVLWDFNCDVFFDWVPAWFKKIDESEVFEENWIKFVFEEYKKS